MVANKIQGYLAQLRDGPDGLSPQTLNYYLGAFKSFCRWMVKERRAVSSPLSHLNSLNANVDRRHDRRALSIEEIDLLLKSTSPGPERNGMGGCERVFLYRVALETGLRAAELRSLTVKNFNLETHSPTVFVAAAYSKRRRRDVLPIRAELAHDLKLFFGRRPDSDSAFNIRTTWMADMLRADLHAARKDWLN